MPDYAWLKYFNPSQVDAIMRKEIIAALLLAASLALAGCESGPKQPRQPKRPEAPQRPEAPERPARPAQPKQPQAAPPVPVSSAAPDTLAVLKTPEIRVE